MDEAGNQDLVRKVCANSKKFGDQKGSFNAYVVFKGDSSVKGALSVNNTLIEERHIRVDKAIPSTYDPKMSVFLGNYSTNTSIINIIKLRFACIVKETCHSIRMKKNYDNILLK